MACVTGPARPVDAQTLGNVDAVKSLTEPEGRVAPPSVSRGWRPGARRRRGGYVLVVQIAVLLMTEVTVGKLAGHGITPDEVRQVNDSDRIVLRNPRPRVDGSILLIGPTHGGRILTVVLNPTASTTAPGTSAPRGHPATPRQSATNATARGASCSHGAR